MMHNLVQSLEIRDVPEADSPARPDLKAEWTQHLIKATYPEKCLKSIKLPNRQRILGNWLKQGDLGFIYGPRGLGKTWLGLYIARKIAEGGSAAHWSVEKPRRVLYVDGEMPFDEICQRNAALTAVETDGLFFLQHEALFHFTDRVLNLAIPAVQDAVLELCKKEHLEVLVLDNLSCLFNGINENDADAWEKVLPWLLALRRARITVIFIAHAGRNGLMRGTSRREDAAFWIIRLDEAKSPAEGEDGARFVARFYKNRNPAQAEPSVEWWFKQPGDDGRIDVSWKKLEPLQVFREYLEDGLTSPTDIAAEMEVSKATVCRLAARAIKEGWLRKEGREYALAG